MGDELRRLVEINLVKQEADKEEGKPGKFYNMLFPKGPYSRTRSVFRHYPLPVLGGGPCPVRLWESPWGLEDLTEDEKTKVVEDDVLMWRGVMIYVVAEE